VFFTCSQFCVNKCPPRCKCTQFIISVNCSTCFGWSLHPSSGAQTTVSAASGTSQPLLLTVIIVEVLRLTQTSLNSSTIKTSSNNGWLVPDAVDTVVCAPDDGWRDHPKHVEQFTDIINCVHLHLVGHLLTQNCDARSQEHKICSQLPLIPADCWKFLN